jgi:hypothetical protein
LQRGDITLLHPEKRVRESLKTAVAVVGGTGITPSGTVRA